MRPSFVDKLSGWYQRRHPVKWDAVHAPLLDETVLRELARVSESLILPEFHRPSAHPLSGEIRSFHRGRGFEFEENRPYIPGDEPRLLNWRLYARSGELHTKIFSEERRPQLFLLLDRRAAMRFGTRRQLKASLAAKIGVCYAYGAQRQGVAVGGIILNQTAQWFAPTIGQSAMHPLIRTMGAACPPLGFEEGQTSIEQNLQELLRRLPAGSFVILISDFSDLDPQASSASLHRLASLHTVWAVQVLDPVEKRLPESGRFAIEDETTQEPLRIDGRDPGQQAVYARAFEDRQRRLDDCFARGGIKMTHCTTLDDPRACLGLHS